MGMMAKSQGGQGRILSVIFVNLRIM